MYDAPPLAIRAAQIAEELRDALSLAPMPPAPPQAPGGPPQGALGAPPPQGPPQASGGAPTPGQVGLGPKQSPSPLQATPSFKSPPMEAFLQKAAGRAQGPVGFAKGGRVLAVKGAPSGFAVKPRMEPW